MSELERSETLDAIDAGVELPRSTDTGPIDDPLLGRLIDERYRITDRLGIGGMGIVYEARHEILGARLAFKVLRKDAAGDEEAIERLKREAQTASSIGNEHIVDVRDFGRLDDGSVYIVMELIEGTDLYTLVKQAPIPWKRARDIALQISEALQAAHERGIVHRDLKLENVLLTTRRGKADFVKVVDFGIAKVMGGTKLTAAGRVMGTPEYMSPEQCAGKQVDHRTDIYSLGVMLYEMVTQKLPFWDSDLMKLIKMQMHQAPVPPSSLRSDLEIPLPFEAVILRLLAKDPAARFPTMRAVMQALRVSGGEDENAAPDDLAEIPDASVVAARATPTQGSVTRSRPWLWPALLVGALAIAGGLGWLFGGDLGDEPIEPAPTIAEPASQPTTTEQPAVAAAPAEAPSAVETSAEITLVSEPPGAEVLAADGALLGETPMSISRPQGDERRELELRRDGFQPHAITVSDLSRDELRVVLVPRATRPRAQPPRVEPPSAPREPPPPAAPREQPRRHQEFLDPWGAPRQ